MGDFSLAFNQINDLTIKQLEKVIKKTVFDLTSAIIKDTPVDTGRLRANWQVSLDSTINNTLDTTDKGGSATISKARGSIMTNKVPLVYWIQNNLPYANVIEFGLYPKNPKTGTRYEIRDRDKFVTETGFVQLSENGYSKKAPMGMARINIARFNKYLKDNIKW